MGTDRLENINYARMREYRLARAKRMMAEHGLGTLITWEAWDMRYLCGAYPTVPCRWLGCQYVVLPRNGEPHLFAATSFSQEAMREEMPWLEGRIWKDDGAGRLSTKVEDLDLFMKTVVDIISAHGLMDELVGLDDCPSEMLYEQAFKKHNLKICNAIAFMAQVRKIKNPDEIACIRMACTTAEAAFNAMEKSIRPGVRECELLGIGIEKLYELGADETMAFVLASGPRTNPLHIDYTDRIIRPGDLVAIDVNANSFNGYKSCYYRTFCCGKATQEQKDVYEIARKMMYDGMSVIKAGATTRDILNMWPQEPQFWGYDDMAICCGYALGHGLGLSLHEYPFFSVAQPKDDPGMLLEENMVLAIETWYGPKGGNFGVRLEECLAVTKDGYELLTKYPVDELIECRW